MSVNDQEIRDVMWHYFPKKEEGYRTHQEGAILNIVRTYLEGKKFAMLEAPTGSGKSVIGYTAIHTIRHFNTGFKTNEKGEQKANYSGPYGLISVHTRALQMQYKNTFPGLPSIWSGTHYKCAIDPEDPKMYWGCGECPKKRCIEYEVCDYAGALDDFMHSSIAITNYSYYLYAPFVKPFVSVIDEAHNLERVLCDWSTVELSTKYLTRLLAELVMSNKVTADQGDGLQTLVKEIIAINDRTPGWLEELRHCSEQCIMLTRPIYAALDAEIEEIKEDLHDPMVLSAHERSNLQMLERASRYFRNLIQKMAPICALETEWSISHRIEERDRGKSFPKVEIKPLYIDEISHKRLFNHSAFFLFMSATFCGHEVFTEYLGIKPGEANYFDMPSVFPVAQRPIFVMTDLGNFVHNNREGVRSLFTQSVDQLLQKDFAGQRGIIHSVSYENALFIKEHSRQVARLAFPESEDLLEIIPLLESREDLVVVSPSVVEGLDLKDDLCRFVIFFKVPYASLGDKWVKARCDKDGMWYAREAIIKIVQGSGRGTRSETDFSQTLILDGQFVKIWKRAQQFFPQWYQDAIQFVNSDGKVVRI